jgi:hypothetical protein
VLSGVTRLVDLPDLATAPDHVLPDVAGLLEPPGPVVRPATPAEQGAAARLLAAAPGGEEDPPGDGDPVTRLVAVSGSGVVGAVELRRSGTPGLLAGPVVDEGWRDRLVATRLAMAACIQARAAGLARVAAPAAAEPLLARLGFVRDPGGGPALVRAL